MSQTAVNLSRRQFFTRQTTSDLPALPWLKAELFTDLCSQCGECVKQCPSQIIRPADGGFPRVDFQLGECSFCYQCAEVCPEPLFLSKAEPAWQAKAVINARCLAQQNVDCRSCGDSCEPFAIRFTLAVGRVAQPQIDLNSCTGCGACVSICPTSAISINNSHVEGVDVAK